MAEDPVLALEHSLNRLTVARNALADAQARHQHADTPSHQIADAFATLSEKWHPVMRQLADTPAESLDGVLLKLRVLAGALLAGREDTYNEDILLLAIADLERLSRGTAPRA